MRITFFSNTGGGIGLAPHLTYEGHAVKVCMSPPDLRTVEEQFIGDKPDIAFFDNPELVVPAEWVRMRGVRVLGPTKWSNLLADNPTYNKQLLSAVGLPAAPVGTGADREAIVCAWFNGNKFISKFLVFNYDKMMSGNVGATVESAGYIAYFGECKLVERVLEPVEKFLRKANHRGCFSINVSVSEKGELFGMSVNANANLPYTNAIYENTRRNKGDLVLAMFDPASAPVEATEPYVCGVMLSVYPYPHAKPEEPLEILGLNSANQKHLWQMDVAKVNEQSVVGQLSGCAGYVTAHGKTIQEATRRVYRTISNLKIDGIQFRNDVGKDVPDKMYKLRELKLI